jgi:hypothetical protein
MGFVQSFFPKSIRKYPKTFPLPLWEGIRGGQRFSWFKAFLKLGRGFIAKG